MKGTRPLDNDEIRSVSTCFTGTYEVRNRGLFMLGVSTGGRISELLSLQIGDVYQNSKPVKDLLFARSIVKGGEISRAVPVNTDGRLAIDQLIDWHRRHYGDTTEYRKRMTQSKTYRRKRSKQNSNGGDTTSTVREKKRKLRRSSKSHDLYARDNDEGKNKKG